MDLSVLVEILSGVDSDHGTGPRRNGSVNSRSTLCPKEEVKGTYATNIEPGENIPNQDIVFNINDQLFLETLLMMIRGKTIEYSSIRKKNKLKEKKNT